MLPRLIALVNLVNLFVCRNVILTACTTSWEALTSRGHHLSANWLLVLVFAASGVVSVIGLALQRRWGSWAAWLNLVVATSLGVGAIPFVLRPLAHYRTARTVALVAINAAFAVLIASAGRGGARRPRPRAAVRAN